MPDLDHAIAHLAASVSERPDAAVLLCQVLRTSDGLDVERGLEIESLAYSTLQGGTGFQGWLSSRPRRERPRREAGPPVLVERDGHRVRIVLNRPAVRNAVDTAVRDALVEACRLVRADGTVRGVDLLGAGPDFCAGGDLDEFGTFPDLVTAHLVRTSRSTARAVAGVAERLTAHLHGACVGAGIELAAFAGHVVAAPGSRCQLPELTLGLVPGSGGTVSVPRRIGRHRTAWLALSAEFVDAPTALGWGLVDEIAPPS